MGAEWLEPPTSSSFGRCSKPLQANSLMEQGDRTLVRKCGQRSYQRVCSFRPPPDLARLGPANPLAGEPRSEASRRGRRGGRCATGTSRQRGASGRSDDRVRNQGHRTRGLIGLVASEQASGIEPRDLEYARKAAARAARGTNRLQWRARAAFIAGPIHSATDEGRKSFGNEIDCGSRSQGQIHGGRSQSAV